MAVGVSLSLLLFHWLAENDATQQYRKWFHRLLNVVLIPLLPSLKCLQRVNSSSCATLILQLMEEETTHQNILVSNYVVKNNI